MPSRRITAAALLMAACSHLEPLSNAYSPFSRELRQGVGRGPVQNEDVAAVSIHELVNKPAAYHHRRVRTDGYVKLQFEGNTACPVETPSDWKECVWLDVEGLQDPGFRKGRAVLEGTFDGENLGHLGIAGGTIGHITSLRHTQ